MTDKPNELLNQAQQLLAQRAVKELSWLPKAGGYIIDFNNIKKSNQSLIDDLVKRKLISPVAVFEDNRSYDSHEALPMLARKIAEDQCSREEAIKAKKNKAAQTIVKQDGYDSILDLVLANVPYEMVNGDVCVSFKECKNPTNKIMLEALDLSSNDFMPLPYGNLYSGMKYVVTGDLRKEFIEKGETSHARELRKKVIRHVFSKPESNPTENISDNNPPPPSLRLIDKDMLAILNDPAIEWSDNINGRMTVYLKALSVMQQIKMLELTDRKIKGKSLIEVHNDFSGAFFELDEHLSQCLREILAERKVLEDTKSSLGDSNQLTGATQTSNVVPFRKRTTQKE